MKCNHCGAEIPNDSVFCEHCGTKVGKSNPTTKNNKKRLALLIGGIAITICIAVMVIVFASKPQFAINEYYSYTQRVTYEGNSINVKSYFLFYNSEEDVVWLMGTTQGNMFPVGFGKYNPQTNEVIFSASNKLHNYIELYKHDDREDIVFYLNPNLEAQLRSNDDFLKQFYNNGNKFSLSHEGSLNLPPCEILVGSKWEFSYENGYGTIYFASWNEAIISESYLLREERINSIESRAYICLGDMVAIKSGDDLDNENAIGFYNHCNTMTLCAEGLEEYNGDDRCFDVTRIDE